MPLADHHRDMLHASAIKDEVIEARGYRSVDADELEELGFSKWQCRMGLLIPHHGVGGEIRDPELRPDEPRIGKTSGKAIKYESPYGSANFLDVNPLMAGEISKPRTVIFITEGAKKVDSLASHDITAIGLKGVWGWRGKNKDGGSTTLPDWEELAIKGNRFVIAFDNDIFSNPMVNEAVRRLKQWLLYRKADSVRVLLLPHDGTEKMGVDDWLASMQKV